MMCRLAALLLALAACSPTHAQENLVGNGEFAQQLTHWSAFWSRSGEGSVQLVQRIGSPSNQAVQIEYPGQLDWSFSQDRSVTVQAGDIFELSGWVQVTGRGQASLSVILYDQEGQSLSWDFGGRPLRNLPRGERITRRFVIPRRGARITARLMGSGPVQVQLDEVTLTKTGTVAALRSGALPPTLSIESPQLQVEFDTRDVILRVTDKRVDVRYTQLPLDGLVVVGAQAAGRSLQLRLLKPDDVLQLNARITLDEQQAELVVELSGSGPMHQSVSFPAPFQTEPGQYLILPVNEGISYPVDDQSLPAMNYHLYGGHGLCMAFYGSTDLKRSVMSIVETPDDARVQLARHDSLLCLAPQWEPQKGEFGPPRRIRYCFLAGDYVAMCKRYRQYAQQTGNFKTLAEKRAENPNVDRLLGAVNVWCWDRSGPDLCAELQQLGIERILWSRRSAPEEIRQMNEMGVLTSRYDIYQDVQDPANFPKLRSVHADWTTDAWPMT